jgi:nucleotide-binding universal stress UspA family protein
MRVCKRILVPVSRGAPSRAGLDEAIRIATRNRAALRLVHVIDDCLTDAGVPGFIGTPDEAIDLITLAGARVLHDAWTVARHAAVACYTVLRDSSEGGTSDLVVREARDWGADLVVMGVDGTSPSAIAEGIRDRLLLPLLTVRWWPPAAACA